MADEPFMLAKGYDSLNYLEHRARREWAAIETAASPAVASAHRLLAIQYEADAKELRRQLVRN